MNPYFLARLAVVVGVLSVCALARAEDAGGAKAGALGRRGAAGTPQQRAQRFIAKYDTDKDGKIDATELAAGFAAMRGRVKQWRTEHPGKGAATTARAGAAAGEKTPQQRAEMFIAKFDTNKDGKLDATELAAGLEALRERLKEHRGAGKGGAGSTSPAAAPAQ